MTNALTTRNRRNHSIEFKTDLVTICRQPEISVSAVGQAHGVNANLLRRWLKKFPAAAYIPVASAPAKLLPVQVDAPYTSLTGKNSIRYSAGCNPHSHLIGTLNAVEEAAGTMDSASRTASPDKSADPDR